MKAGPLDLADLAKRNYVAIVQHITQREGVIHQVTLRADKVFNGLIRLGDTPGDELCGWNYPQNIRILAVLGEGAPDISPGGTVCAATPWKCVPILEKAA